MLLDTHPTRGFTWCELNSSINPMWEKSEIGPYTGTVPDGNSAKGNMPFSQIVRETITPMKIRLILYVKRVGRVTRCRGRLNQE